VQDAFLDATKAREDKARLINEAEAYAKDRLPKARGAAARELAEALAYRDRLIAEAHGEAERFTKVLTEYRKAPRVTRDRLYLETMSDVMGNATKIVVDANKNGGPMIYLPLDQMMKRGGSAESGSDAAAGGGNNARSGAQPGDYRSRERGAR
jgi:modulator of FtsH protease HflK